MNLVVDGKIIGQVTEIELPSIVRLARTRTVELPQRFVLESNPGSTGEWTRRRFEGTRD